MGSETIGRAGKVSSSESKDVLMATGEIALDGGKTSGCRVPERNGKRWQNPQLEDHPRPRECREQGRHESSSVTCQQESNVDDWRTAWIGLQ